MKGGTKAELADAVYRRHGALTRAEALAGVDAVLEVLKTTLGSGRAVRIRTFGSFEVVQRAARPVVTPDGSSISLPRRRAVVFRPSRRLARELEG